MSPLEILRENPLYLPQAKIHEGSCALSPSIITVDEVGKEPNLRIECRVYRSGVLLFEGSTSTSQMKRSFEELGSIFACMILYLPVRYV